MPNLEFLMEKSLREVSILLVQMRPNKQIIINMNFIYQDGMVFPFYFSLITWYDPT